MFEDSLGIENQTVDDQKPSEGNGRPSWWVGRWAHVIALPTFCLLYLPFKDHPWAWQVAIAGSYSVFAFGRAFGSAFKDADDLFGNSQVPRCIATLLLPHALILAIITLAVSAWLHLKPVLPSWVTYEGREGSLWDLCLLIPLVIAGIREATWMAGKIMRRLDKPED
jgi:hypothetical protein